MRSGVRDRPPRCPFSREDCEGCIGWLTLDDFAGCFIMSGFQAVEDLTAAISRSKYAPAIKNFARAIDQIMDGDDQAASVSIERGIEIIDRVRELDDKD